ncbi:hypothetical protein [Methanobrevibacter sp.]|uniref:hypothetical protein n=1 Tax=Methanobrevibacter sp. TaxID=66852 RepID=UPI003890189B
MQLISPQVQPIYMGRLTSLIIYGTSQYIICCLSMAKTYILYNLYGILNDEIFTYELLIAVILTQIYIIHVHRKLKLERSLVKLTIANVILTTFAWSLGTTVIACPYGIGRYPFI